MPKTIVNWTSPGWYSGQVSGDICMVEYIGSTLLTEQQANERARRVNRGTPTMIDNFADTFRWGDEVWRLGGSEIYHSAPGDEDGRDG